MLTCLILDLVTGMMSSLLLILIVCSILLNLVNRKNNEQKAICSIDNCDPMYVSVIVPFRNDDIDQLRKFLESILKLDWPKDLVEVLIVDDSDAEVYLKVRKLVREFENSLKIKLLHRTRPTGYKAGALMYALKHAEGDVIAIFDVDTHPCPDFLKKLCIYLRSGFDYAQALTKFRSIINTISSRIILTQEEWFNRIVLRCYRRAFMIRGHSFIIWRHVLDSVGSLDVPHARLTEDVELTVRLKLGGFRGVIVNEFLTTGLSAPTYGAYLLQRARWVVGGLIVLSRNLLKLLKSQKLELSEKVEFLHNYVSRLCALMLFPLCTMSLTYYVFSTVPGTLLYIVMIVLYCVSLIYLFLLCTGGNLRFSIKDLPNAILSALLWASTSLFLIVYAVISRRWYVTPKSPESAKGKSLIVGLAYAVSTLCISSLATYASLMVAFPLLPLSMYLLMSSILGLVLAIDDLVALRNVRS